MLMNSIDEVKVELERVRMESYDKIRLLEEKLVIMENEMSRMKEEKVDLEKEYEDFLVMLIE